MRWLNFLHLYQPANIDSFNFKLATDKSYYRLLRLMEENQSLKMTWNITGCLLERLEIEGELDFIKRIKLLVSGGRLELVSSAAYHPLLPLIPSAEAIKQIKENEIILKKFFGKNLKLEGFFLPEMAYSPAVAKLIKALGYKWLIVDELAFDGGQSRPDFRRLYQDKHSGLTLIFRNRYFSNSYPPDKLTQEIKEHKFNRTINFEQEKIIITATDAELYGLRHKDQSGELEKIVKQENLSTETISEFINRLKLKKVTPINVAAQACSWETNKADIKNKEPFKLWQSKKNKIHFRLWKLTSLALSMENYFSEDSNYYWYRWHLVRGLASCNFWWASAHDFSKVFGPYAWSPDAIERGLEDLIRAFRSLNSKKSKRYKLQAEKEYLKIKKLIWEEHWKKHWRPSF